MSESLPPISIKIEDEIQDENESVSKNSRAPDSLAEAKADKLIERTKLIRGIIGNIKEQILGRFKENPFTLDTGPEGQYKGQYIINHYDKETLVKTYIRISRDGELKEQDAFKDQITEVVPVTINLDELLAKSIRREKLK